MVRKRKRRSWWTWLLAALAALLVIYLAVSPLLIAWRMSTLSPGDLFYPSDVEQRLLPIALVVFLAAWTFMFGGAVGSFLNVVAWRMPRGESVISRPSHCPRCQTNIAARDNVPVFGWLLLRGRCRTCRLPISPRYPIVEALLGAAFLALGAAEVFTGGANLPGTDVMPAYARDSVSLLTVPDAQLLGLYAFHCLLLSLLAACALIRYDGRRLPTTIVIVGIVAGAALSAAWPQLHPLAWRAGGEVRSWPERLQTGLVGLGMGTCLELLTLAAALPCFRAKEDPQRQRWSPLAVTGMIGLFLGWQPLAGVLLVGGSFALLAAALSRASRAAARLPLAACYALAALVQISLWRPLEALAWWPGSDWPLWQWAVAACAGVALAALASCLARPVEESSYRIELADDEGREAGPYDETAPFPASRTGGDAPTEDRRSP